MKISFFRYFLLSAIIFALFSSISFALEKAEITDLSVSKSMFELTVNLNNDPSDIDKLLLYEAMEETNDESKFSLIMEIAPDAHNVTIMGNKLAVTGNRDSFFQEGTGSYYVKLKSMDDMSGRSEIFFNENPMYQHFLNFFINSTPQADASTGSEYIYNIQVVERGNQFPKAVYTLEKAPDGTEMDPETGIITWTPTESGNYEFLVSAVSGDNANLKDQQSWTVKVLDCDMPASVSMNLAWSGTGEAESAAFVWLYRERGNELEKYEMLSRDGNGMYSANRVSKGTYYLFVHDIDAKPVWYGNADFQYNAEPINLDCGDQINITMELEPGSQWWLIFENSPAEEGNLGEEYTYDGIVQGADGAELNYKIVDGPEGATFDNGTLRWIPTEPGYHEFSIRAEIKGNPYYAAKLHWKVYVPECDVKGSIIVHAFDINKLPEDKFFVHIVKTKDGEVIEERIEYVSGSEFNLEDLDAGTYYIGISDPDSIISGEKGDPMTTTFWYERGTSIDDATPIIIDCGVNKDISVSMEPESILSVDERYDHESVKVYPNPAGDHVNISIENQYNIHSIMIYDNTGNMVSEFNNTGAKTIRLDLGSLSTGRYYIRIFNSSNVITKPLNIIK